MSDNEPRDYRLARRAYETYMGEQPQVWFNELNHDFQMRWVRVIRALEEERKLLSKGGKPSHNGAARIYKNSPERREEMRLAKRAQLAKRKKQEKRQMSETQLAAVRQNAMKARAVLAAKHKSNPKI